MAANSKTRTPAGTKRIPAMKKGVVWGITPFIATIAVPQRKNGAISNTEVNGSLDSANLEAIPLGDSSGSVVLDADGNFKFLDISTICGIIIYFLCLPRSSGQGLRAKFGFTYLNCRESFSFVKYLAQIL